MPKTGPAVTRPGRNWGGNAVSIPAPEELETVPGIPQRLEEVDRYSKEYPSEGHDVENRAHRQRADTVGDIRTLHW